MKITERRKEVPKSTWIFTFDFSTHKKMKKKKKVTSELGNLRVEQFHLIADD